MDKSESELLADWDVVSSVDTEQVNDATDAKPSSTTTNNDAEDNTNNKPETDVKDSESHNDEITVDNKTAIESEKIPEPESEQANEADVASEHTSEASAEEISELVTVIEQISEVEAVMEQNSELDEIVEQEADTASEDVTREVVADIVDSTVKSAEPEPDSVKTTDENIEKFDVSSDIKTDIDKESAETLSGNNNNLSADTNSVDNCDDRATSSSLDSSMEHIQIEYCGASRVQEVPELIDLVEQDSTAIESSSSDIDIIDENMEESFTSSFVHPLTLSMNSSFDTSSVMTTPLEIVKEIKTEKGTEAISTIPKTESHKETYRELGFSIDKPASFVKRDSFTKDSEAHPKTSEKFQKSRHSEKKKEGTQQRSSRQEGGGGIFAAIKGFLRNMTHIEWSILGGVMLCLYVTVVFNQTNIFAVVERENVVLQMKQMLDELKLDNKMLKDQMLSEMKNEKVFSSVEHQIKELKKENSKLNHMLYDVVKVLEEQKDSQEKFKKKEPDFATPFKKEINKLKEHINILKIDNEDLQKQLVRMRYASYSQGGSEKTEEKTKTSKDEIKPDETFTDEISLDINSLKKWNELVTLLTKELGLSSENEPIREEKPDIKDNISWYWKVFLREFKGTFKDFKENVTSIFSDYKQANEKAVSEIYKFVKEFFTVEENNRQFTPPGTDSSQWKNIGDFVNDLKNKWTNIKDRIYASDLKDFMKNFRKSGEAVRPTEKTKSGVHESHDRKPTDFERKPTTVYFESEQKATTEPDRKYDKVQTNPEDAKWMFKRAELRAELRDTEEEDMSENWFLKRKRRDSEDDGEKLRY